MSSDLVDTLKTLQQNDYIATALIAVVGYDYILTFGEEVEYVWVRYVGLCAGVSGSLVMSALFPGTVMVYVHSSKTPHNLRMRHMCLEGTIVLLLCRCAFALFLATANLLMLLRVYAMWGRSKPIIGTLLLVYIPTSIAQLVNVGIFTTPTVYNIASQMGDISDCIYTHNTVTMMVSIVLECTLGFLQFALVIIATFKELQSMYTVTKHFQLNRYMKLLVREGIVYFFMTLIFFSTNAAGASNTDSPTWKIILVTVAVITMVPIMPRFVLNIRKMHGREIRQRLQGIDTAFGLSSHPITGRNVEISAVMFAEGASDSPIPEAQDDEELQLELIPVCGGSR